MYRKTTGVALSAFASLVAFGVAAEQVDTRYGATITTGTPLGACPMYRVNPERTGLVDKLPAKPRRLWHTKAPDSIGYPPVVDRNDRLYFVTPHSDLMCIDSDGHLRWNQKDSTNATLGAPVVASDNHVLVRLLGGSHSSQGLTDSVKYYGTDGRFLRQVSLSRSVWQPTTAPMLPLADGTIAAGSIDSVFALSVSATVQRQASVTDAWEVRRLGQELAGHMGIHALLGRATEVVVTTSGGDVFVWGGVLAPQYVGTLGGVPSDTPCLRGPHYLLAVVDHSRLIQFDLRDGSTVPLLHDTMLNAPPAVSADGTAYVTTASHEVVALSVSGQSRRLALHSSGPAASGAPTTKGSFEPPIPGISRLTSSDATDAAVVSTVAPLLVDRDKRVVFASDKGTVGVIAPDWTSGDPVHIADQNACSDPLAVVPLSEARFVVACRSGDIFLYGP